MVVRYRFGEYLLDTQRYALWDQNAWTPLRPKIFAVLLYLLQHRDRVVSKTELLEHIWPAQFIGDGSLNACLMAVRKALGDTGQTQRYIQTLRGYGYRFVALVHEEADEVLAPQPVMQYEAPVTPSVPLAPPASVSTPVGLHDAERRHLTVLYGALADADRLAEQLDPETFREVVQAYHQTCRAVMPRFGGYVARHHEASVLVYFGYPQAHDGAAQHAARAGLALLAAWKPVQARLAQEIGRHIAVCAGIDTGLVVVDEAHDEAPHPPLAVGHTPHRAGLIQAWASPDTVVISAATHRLVEGTLLCVSLGQQTLRGLAQPLALYRVLPETALERGLAVPTSRLLTPLVGREAEVALLLDRWTQVKAGFGQVVLLRGEAGIGKSRLVAALQVQVAQEPHTCLEGRCTPYDQHTAWSPLTTALQRFLQWHPHAPAATQHATLDQVVHQYGLPPATTVPGLALLLGSDLSDEPYDMPFLDPEHQRQQILVALLALLTAVARRQPLVFILEDVHWSDPSTLELLTRLVDAGPAAAIYTLVTCRPPWQPDWVGRAHVTSLVVPRLSPAQAAALVRRVAGSTVLHAEVLDHLVQQTDGVPLFLEELTKTVLESDAFHRPASPPLDLAARLPLPIPSTLQDSLTARLDCLGTAKRLAQVGAMIGREFSYTLLQAITALEDATLQHQLARLVAAELVYQHGLPPQATYVFKHALIRDAAYQSMLQRTRQQLHARLVCLCAESGTPETVLPPALLAHHATQAGLLPQALAYWQQAGAHALQQGAYHEAMSHLQRGFAVLDRLPAGPERLRHETELALALTPVMLIVQGAGSPEVERLTTRAYALSQQLEQSPAMFPALRSLHYVAWTQGQLQTAQELAERLLVLAQTSTDAVLHLEAHLAMGTTLWYGGLCGPALRHLQQGLGARSLTRRLTVQRVPHPELGCLLYSALVLWYLGYPDQAQRRLQEGLAYAAQMAQPHHLVWGQHLGAMFYRLGRQRPQAQALIEAVVQAAAAHGMTLAVAGGQLMQEWALADHPPAPFAQYQPRLTAYRARSGPLGLAQHLVWLAEAYAQHGQYTEGLHALAEARHLAAYTGEQLVCADMLRVHGELLALVWSRPQANAQVPPPPAAEDVLQQALTLARQQEAKILELRAAVSLSRVWQTQGQGARAREVLGAIYAWFTEGFETVDLQEAQALLADLA